MEVRFQKKPRHFNEIPNQNENVALKLNFPPQRVIAIVIVPN